MREWAVPETRMHLERIRDRSGEEGWTVTWTGRGWSGTFESYRQLFDARSSKMLVVPSVKYHLPTPRENCCLSRRTSVRRFCPTRLSPDFLDSIFELDRDIFGADRSSLLESLHQEVPDFTFAIRNANIVEGYGFGRRGCYADHFGPWMATDAQVARQLSETFLASCGRDAIVVDCLKSNTMARSMLQSFGFNYSRLLTRMYRGANLHPGSAEPLCAILGPEFG